MAYESPLPYHTDPMNAAVVYCSDGRVCQQCDEFVAGGLQMPRVDRMVIPGGPAVLAGHDDQTRLKQADVLGELSFLVEAHELDRVVLIQHEDCAFYKVCLGVDAESLEQTQKADLARAAQIIRETANPAIVEGFFARRTDAGVAFEPVNLD